MNSPYKYRLDEIFNSNPAQDVIITRADAPELVGRVSMVEEDGVTIVSPHPENDEASIFNFVAYGDIRGVGYVGWNAEVI